MQLFPIVFLLFWGFKPCSFCENLSDSLFECDVFVTCFCTLEATLFCNLLLDSLIFDFCLSNCFVSFAHRLDCLPF